LVGFCDASNMSVAVASMDSSGPLLFEDLYQFWAERCEQFLSWQRKNFIQREASAQELAEHSKRLSLMLRFTLHVYSLAADPDSPRPEAIRAIAGRLKQLENWRTVIHDSLTEEEANEILARAFPG